MTHLVWTCTIFFCLLAVLNLGECKPLSNDIDTQQKDTSPSKGSSLEIRKAKEKPRTISTTTEDAVSFAPGEPVSLQIPDKIFGSSFTLITNLSTQIGDYLMNSAVRAQRLLESMRPFFRAIAGSKSIVIEGPSDKPIFSDGTAT
ncbi:uncharacterized protein [Diabrotica undecimpunctata]|uniref:uncharacterized protein isoform X2 n=1 Tax=Diabrotica undecimpunctata TaxID=50387 RepID=UPI003B633387